MFFERSQVTSSKKNDKNENDIINLAELINTKKKKEKKRHKTD